MTSTATETAAAQITPAMAEKLAFVKAHAVDFAHAGWDMIIEACTDEQLVEAIGKARSLTGAINNVREHLVWGFVANLVNTRPGEDDDPQLQTYREYEAELFANYYDATARLEGRTNRVPTRKEATAFGISPARYTELLAASFSNAPAVAGPAGVDIKVEDTGLVENETAEQVAAAKAAEAAGAAKPARKPRARRPRAV